MHDKSYLSTPFDTLTVAAQVEIWAAPYYGFFCIRDEATSRLRFCLYR